MAISRQGSRRVSTGLIAGFLLLWRTSAANAQEPSPPGAPPEESRAGGPGTYVEGTLPQGQGNTDDSKPVVPADAPAPVVPVPPVPPASVEPSAPPQAATPEAVPSVEPEPDTLGAVVVTGTRRSARTVFESNVPVDVVSRADLQAIPSADLNDKLALTVPSFNVQRLPLYDGAIFNRPATLRGLSPDQTLVLINGKRRHRSAFIDITAQGAQAVDLSEIPQSAIERI